MPGVPRLLETVHARYGKRDWADLLQPAIELAEAGFAVSPRLSALIAEDAGRLDGQPAARAYFFDAAGAPLAVGATASQPGLCRDAAGDRGRRRRRLLQRARSPASIVAAVRATRPIRAALTADDLAAYRVKERPAVCAPYRGYRSAAWVRPPPAR